jgi:[ribosomal protein S5]-alanine N-acetyltransferase
MIPPATLPTIATERLALRWLTEDDIPALFAVFSHPEVMRYWSTPPMKDVGEARALLERIHESFRLKTLFEWGIALGMEGRVIGTCTLFRLDEQNRRAELGYALAREYWGQGLMSEALTALLEHAFSALDLHRIEADVDPRNAPSVRILERLGFEREGLFRERWLVAGERQDSLMLGLLRHGWRSRRRAVGRQDREPELPKDTRAGPSAPWRST